MHHDWPPWFTTDFFIGLKNTSEKMLLNEDVQKHDTTNQRGDCSRTSEIEAIYVHSPPYSFKIKYQQSFQTNFLWNFLRPIALYGIVANERRCTSGDHCRLGRIYWINTALFSKPIDNLESLKASSGGRITARMFWIQIYLNKLSFCVYNCILVTLCGFNVCNVG